MKTAPCVIICLASFCNVICAPCFGQVLESAAGALPPPRGGTVCIGSSSMQGWHLQITNDLAPLPILAHGVNGSTMDDAIRYADSVVIPREPRAVVIYEGDNDIARGVSPERVAANFDTFVKKVHAAIPTCRIYFLSIKPSPARWKLWPKMTEANNLIAAACEKDTRLIYVEVASGMLGESGAPRKELFQADQLHMNRRGYEIWRDALRPVLVELESDDSPKP